MDTKASYVAAGTFVIGLIIALIFFIIWINQIDWSEGKKYDIYFSGSITGLRESEIVSYNGVPIGRVEKIDIDPDKVNLIRVMVEIDEPELIRENSYAILEAKGITGSVQVTIHGSTPESPILKSKTGQRHPVIQSQISAFQTVIEETPKILGKIAKLLDNVEPLFNEDNRKAISAAFKNIDVFSKALADQSKDLKGFFSQAMKSFKNLGDAGENLDKAMQQVDMILAENRPYIHKFTSTNLQDTGNLVAQLQAVAGTLDRVLQKLEPNPAQYFFQSAGQGEKIEE